MTAPDDEPGRCTDLTKYPKGWLRCPLPAGHDGLHAVDFDNPGTPATAPGTDGPVVLDLDDPFFDGQTLPDALRDYDHVHSTTGVCVKNVTGPFCGLAAAHPQAAAECVCGYDGLLPECDVHGAPSDAYGKGYAAGADDLLAYLKVHPAEHPQAAADGQRCEQCGWPQVSGVDGPDLLSHPLVVEIREKMHAARRLIGTVAPLVERLCVQVDQENNLNGAIVHTASLIRQEFADYDEQRAEDARSGYYTWPRPAAAAPPTPATAPGTDGPTCWRSECRGGCCYPGTCSDAPARGGSDEPPARAETTGGDQGDERG